MMFRLSLIAFIFLLSMALLGCAVINNGSINNKGEEKLVKSLDAVILTVTDLPTMREGVGTPSHRVVGYADDPPVVDGFTQFWETQYEDRIRVRYWLFGSVTDAQAAAAWRDLVALPMHQPVGNAADIIGDATWSIPNKPNIWFVKSNVLVHITGNQLALTRSAARKIETKINAVLNQP